MYDLSLLMILSSDQTKNSKRNDGMCWFSLSCGLCHLAQLIHFKGSLSRI